MSDKEQDLAVFSKLFAEWLRVLRKRLEVTQVELGDLIGVRAEPISRWENEREIPLTPNMIRLMALATVQERAALIEKGADGLDDLLKIDEGSHLVVVECEDCLRHLRVRDFTTKGWPAPRLIRKPDDPYAVRLCPRCSARR